MDNPNDDGIQTGDESVLQSGQAQHVDAEADDYAETSTDNPESEESGGEDRKYAGVYKSVEELEKGYKELQAEYTRAQQQQGKAGDDASGVQAASAPDDELRNEVAGLRIEREWDKLEAQYGAGTREKVREYFEQLPVDDQATLNNMAGARLIAKTLNEGVGSSGAAQATGAARSHRGSSSTLTRAQIRAMSPDEYAQRQGEIMRFYAENNTE